MSPSKSSAQAITAKLVSEVRACKLCEAHLPLGPRPVVQVQSGARILIAGQAPGSKVHQSGVPFEDASGDRLRDWMDIDKATFYDAARVAILPMGFCWPGRRAGGDLPPRPECAPAWHERLLAALPKVKLYLLVLHHSGFDWLLPGRARRGPAPTGAVSRGGDTDGSAGGAGRHAPWDRG